MKSIAVFNEDSVSPEEALSYDVRIAVRVIVFDLENKVAVLHAQVPGFYELPGGGVEDKEQLTDTVIRECREEIGCDVAIDSEIGHIFEYRKASRLLKRTYCFTAHIQGKKEVPSLTVDEKKLNLEIKWVSPTEACNLIKSSSTAQTYLGRFAVKRDTLFLKEVKGY